jgi:hypothetical protein
MSTLAVFLLLAGGTAFAIDKISGSKLKNNSVSAKKLKKNIVVPRALTAKTTEQLVVSGAKRGGKSALSSSESSAGGIVRLDVGETATVLEREPFKFTATCTGSSDGVAKITEYVTSSEDGWTDLFLETHDAGEQVKYFETSSADPQFILVVPAVAVAADGRTVATGTTELGVHAFGGDCVIYQYLIG